MFAITHLYKDIIGGTDYKTNDCVYQIVPQDCTKPLFCLISHIYQSTKWDILIKLDGNNGDCYFFLLL